MLDMQFGDHMPVLDHGYVALLDMMGSDSDIVDAARISYDRRGRSENRSLLRYLLRRKHTTPFEMAVMKFEVSMPIQVARQWIRHRTASVNEVSARYTQLPSEMYVPNEFSVQSTDNKQGRGEVLGEGIQKDLRRLVQKCNVDSYDEYTCMLEVYGVSKEMARGVLNLNIYTKFIWKMDLHNLMHFLELRLDPHAQKEIREYAEVIEKIVALKFPLCYEAFVDYQRDAYTCSRMEVEILRSVVKRLRDDMSDVRGQGGEDDHMMHDLLSLCENVKMSKRETDDFMRRFYNG